MSRFDADALLDEARARTGLADFGPHDFLEPYRLFVGDLDRCAQIAPDRAEWAKERILRLLINRLWFARDLAEHPEILDEDLGTPIIVTTLPRTGSTKLHRLLAASGDFNALTFWQVHMPSRIPGEADGGATQRQAITRQHEEWMYRVSPGILAGHPMFTDEAEECQWLMEQSLAYPILYGLFEAPSMLGWLMQNGVDQAYDYYKLQLQYLQWQRGGRQGKPWLLKSPTHFGAEPQLDRIFGDFLPVVTHRDPAKCIPSITSTSNAARQMYSDRLPGDGLLEALTGMFAGAAQAHLAWREARRPAVCDIAFDTVTGRSDEAVAAVYAFAGLELSAEARERMRAWETNENRNRHAKAIYSAEAHGGSEEAIRQAFAPYCTAFAGLL